MTLQGKFNGFYNSCEQTSEQVCALSSRSVRSEFSWVGERRKKNVDKEFQYRNADFCYCGNKILSSKMEVVGVGSRGSSFIRSRWSRRCRREGDTAWGRWSAAGCWKRTCWCRCFCGCSPCGSPRCACSPVPAAPRHPKDCTRTPGCCTAPRSPPYQSGP